jgi:hypothetical protein
LVKVLSSTACQCHDTDTCADDHDLNRVMGAHDTSYASTGESSGSIDQSSWLGEVDHNGSL